MDLFYAATHTPFPAGHAFRSGNRRGIVVDYRSETDTYFVKWGSVGNRTYGSIPASRIGYQAK